MIVGIGTDIVRVERVRRALDRHGEAFAERILAPDERPAFSGAKDPARFLAKRFAAKEAFAKAFGTGLRPPATLGAIAVAHDALGKPEYALGAPLAAALAERGWRALLSLSDEREYVVAFALIEQRPGGAAPKPTTDCR